MLIRITKSFLLVTWLHIFLIWEYPDLQKLHLLISIFIFFRMDDSSTCTHNLYIALPDHLVRTHIITMFQISFKRNGYDFHIIMRVFAKTHTWGYGIIVQYS